jgi:AraC family transcriptional regulator, carnitine catabolism transcriptional activator
VAQNGKIIMIPQTCRIAVLLVPGFSHLGVALVTEPLFIANWLAGRPVFGWTTLSADGLAVPSSSGISLPVDQPLLPTTPFDLALVVASFDPRRAAADARVLQWLRRAARAGVRIGGVETGCEIVAAAELLEGVETPVHWYNIEGARERLPGLRAVRRLFANDGNHPLSAGGTATLDLMLDLIAREAGSDLAHEVAAHLLCNGPRVGAQPQMYPSPESGPAGEPGDAALSARALLEATLDEPLSVPQVAARTGVSARHLQRLCRARFGQSLRELRDDLRMAAAHQRVQQTDLSLTEIAVACGFSSLAAFSRSYRRRFGVPPSRDRRQSTDSTVYRLSVNSGHRS